MTLDTFINMLQFMRDEGYGNMEITIVTEGASLWDKGRAVLNVGVVTDGTDDNVYGITITEAKGQCVDAVPVVRCKNCKHFFAPCDSKRGSCDKTGIGCSAEEFCSDGEAIRNLYDLSENATYDTLYKHYGENNDSNE